MEWLAAGSVGKEFFVDVSGTIDRLASRHYFSSPRVEQRFRDDLTKFLEQLESKPRKKLPKPVLRPLPIIILEPAPAPVVRLSKIQDKTKIRDVDDQNRRFNYTRLHAAIMEIDDLDEMLKEVSLLIELNANPFLKDSSGETALDKARDEGYTIIVQVLSSYCLSYKQ